MHLVGILFPHIADYKFHTYFRDTAVLSLKSSIKYQGELCIGVGQFATLNCYTLSVLPLIGATRYQILIHLLTAIGLSPGGSGTVHIYTQTIHRTTQNRQYIEQYNNLGECGPCPVLASYTLAFALQLREKQGKTSIRVAAS